MKKFTIILTTLLLIQLGAFSQSEDLHKLLPEASELDNVALVGDPVIYTADNLAEIAPNNTALILEYGFEQAIVADYKDPERGESYHLEIYEMSDLYAAYGIYTILQLYDATPDDIGEEGQIVNNEAIFVQGKYVVRMEADSEDEDNEAELKEAAKFISTRLSAV